MYAELFIIDVLYNIFIFIYLFILLDFNKKKM